MADAVNPIGPIYTLLGTLSLRDDMPAPQSRKNDTCDQVTSVRCQLSAFFRDLAGRIAPPPAVRGR